MVAECAQGPLAGTRIIDLTRILAGPFCTMNLGDMGAEIIKVEQPERGDDTRGWGPPFAGDEAAYFLGVNRNKRSVTLNLKDVRGKDLLRNLLANADVLIENFKPGQLAGWGFTSEWMAKHVPQVVHCAITGYGDKGPKGGMPGYDFLLQAESGLMSITGEADGRPTKLGVAIVDVCTGQYAAMCIVAALQARQRTGRGQKVEVSLFNTSLSILVNVASNYLIAGGRPGRYGNGHPNIVPYCDYPCAIGEIALAVGNDLQFAKFANLVDHPEWAADERFRTNADRVTHRGEIDGLIVDALSKKPAREWILLFEAEGIPCTKVNSVDEALQSAQAAANDMVVTMQHATAGTVRALGIPYTFSETPASVQSPPPVIGADTYTVLADLAGLTRAEIDALRRDGVV